MFLLINKNVSVRIKSDYQRMANGRNSRFAAASSRRRISDSLSMHCSLLIPACAYSTTVFTIPNASHAFLNKTLRTSANRNNGKRTHNLTIKISCLDCYSCNT